MFPFAGDLFGAGDVAEYNVVAPQGQVVGAAGGDESEPGPDVTVERQVGVVDVADPGLRAGQVYELDCGGCIVGGLPLVGLGGVETFGTGVGVS